MYNPHSLLYTPCLPLLALSTQLLICKVLISESLHVPAHAFVQACVDLGQIRRWPPVAEGGQPHLAKLTLADTEVRQAENTNGKVE